MSIVPAKCTNCGGILQVEESKDAAVCPFCQTPYIVEKAINNYKISNQYNINNSEVHIYGNGLSDDERYENANSFLTIHKDYTRAAELFNDLIVNSPNDYRGWWGVIRTKTKEFTYYGISIADMQKLVEFASSSVKVCNDSIIVEKIKKQWNSYKNKYDTLIKLKNEKIKYQADLSNNLKKLETPMGIYALIALFMGGPVLIILLSLATPTSKITGGEIGGYVFCFALGLFLLIGFKSGTSKSKEIVDNAKRELERINLEISKIDPDNSIFKV